MKQYKYVRLENISNYNGWEIIEILPRINECLCNGSSNARRKTNSRLYKIT